jgi:tetratricopeptide (TPR) repeat protein
MQVSNLSVTVDVPARRTVDRCQKREAQRHHDLSVYLAESGKTKDAIEEDQQAITCDPNHPGYQILMGRLLVENGQLTEAMDCYRHVCRRFPEEGKAIAELVMGLEQTLTILNLDCVRNSPDAKDVAQPPAADKALSMSTSEEPAPPGKRPARTPKTKSKWRLFMADQPSANDSTY